MCMCVGYACMCMYSLRVSAFTCVCGGQRSTLGVFLSHMSPCFLRRGLSLSRELTDWRGWLTTPYPLSSAGGYRHTTRLGFCMGSGATDSHLPACLYSKCFTTESSPKSSASIPKAYLEVLGSNGDVALEWASVSLAFCQIT